MSILKITKKSLIRLGLLLASVAVITFMLPRSDRQSLQYELNQPWKYQLLTAPFDMPLMRDSATVQELRDSVDRSFVPFVKRDNGMEEMAITRFRRSMADSITPAEINVITAAMHRIYADGIIDTSLAGLFSPERKKEVRVADNGEPVNTVTSLDATNMRSPAKAFQYVDSVYSATFSPQTEQGVSAKMARALNVCIAANVLLDTLADTKYRNQEYLNATAAQGVIKQGQRIVDRGEIISPQVYTNLRTYEQMVQERQVDSLQDSYFTLGQALFALVAMTLLFLFLRVYRPRYYADLKKVIFLVTYITLFVVLTVIVFENFNSGIWLVPFAAVPVVILVFFDSRTALFSLCITVFLSSMVATFQYQFIIIEMSVGIMAALSLTQLTSRSQLLRTALIAFLGYCVMFVITLWLVEGNLLAFSWRFIGLFAINTVILSFAYILIVVVEKVFGFTSTVTLVELSDINNPLLRRLAEEAPGTFQHSMQVSTLASEAARAVNANTQLVRTGALYHDIGKMESPVFFTENQHGVNPHAGLDPQTSARKIIRHVTSGLQMAAKAKLPAVIRDFISEHHGKGVTRYFYNQEANAHSGECVDPEPFTYPGPNPRSRETAILMMADAVEAASRSLKDRSPEAIDKLVNKIIDSQIADGLFNDSPITFHDVQVIKSTFKKRLGNIYHSRVEYPELHSNTATAREAHAAHTDSPANAAHTDAPANAGHTDSPANAPTLADLRKGIESGDMHPGTGQND